MTIKQLGNCIKVVLRPEYTVRSLHEVTLSCVHELYKHLADWPRRGLGHAGEDNVPLAREVAEV